VRIRFLGKPSPDEFADRITALVVDLNALGIDALAGSNVYFRPKRGDRDVEICGPDGEPVEIIELGPPVDPSRWRSDG
jgi:hypothetical protein